MCQSKADGGERCAAHTGQELTKAMETAKNEPSAVNNAELMKAMEAYNRTATGTKELRERGDKASIELAEKYEAERASRLKARREAKTPKSGIVKASFQEGNEEPQLFTVTYTEGKREEAYNEAYANAMKAMKTTGRGGSVKTLYEQEEIFEVG